MGFCCYDVRGFGDSEGQFTDYTLSDWIADARTALKSMEAGPPVTIVGNSLGSWIAWLVAQEFAIVEELILFAPAFNMMGSGPRLSPKIVFMTGILLGGCPGMMTRCTKIGCCHGNGWKKASSIGQRPSIICVRYRRPFSTGARCGHFP